MRSEKSIKNVLVTWGGLLFVSLGGFVVRIVLARVMAEEYLGLNGLFGNIISVLSLAELGVGPAITFSLYRPIAENDTKQITALMRLYRRFYIGVGIFVILDQGYASECEPYLLYLFFICIEFEPVIFLFIQDRLCYCQPKLLFVLLKSCSLLCMHVCVADCGIIGDKEFYSILSVAGHHNGA